MGRKAHFSQEEIEQVRRLSPDHAYTKIAKILGRSNNSIRVICRRHGIYLRKLTKEESSSLRESMLARLENPVNYYKLREKMKVCWSPEARAKAWATRKANGNLHVPRPKLTEEQRALSRAASIERKRAMNAERYKRVAAEKRAADPERRYNRKLDIDWGDAQAKRKYKREYQREYQIKLRRSGHRSDHMVEENKAEQVPPIEKPKKYVTSPWRARWRIVPEPPA